MKNPLDLPALIDWLERQPPRATYDYGSNTKCLCCQYLNFVGFSHVSCGSYTFTEWRDKPYSLGRPLARHPLPKLFNEVAKYGDLGPRTFGGALAFARSLT